MVQVQYAVLQNVYHALKDGGRVLIIQPDPAPAPIEIEVNGNLLISEIIDEPNFAKVLEATEIVINSIVHDGLYHLLLQKTMPSEISLYRCVRYASIDKWLEDHLPFSVDKPVLENFASKAKGIVGNNPHTLKKLFKEKIVILKKM